MLQYIESIPIIYVQLGQTVDCCTHVHIAVKFEESGYTCECKPHDSLEVDLKPH
jgi:hypothetical protein